MNAPVLLQKREDRYCTPCPVDIKRLKRPDFMRIQDRRVLAPRRRGEHVTELLLQNVEAELVRVHIHAPVHAIGNRAQIVYAVRLVGVIVRNENAVEMRAPRIQQLLAQIRRSVDKHGRCPIVAALAQQNGASPPPVLRIVRIAGAPISGIVRTAQARNAGRGAASENGDFQSAHGRFARVNSRKKFSVVVSASAAKLTPFISASISAVCRTNAGSLRLPRWGMGARNGASVSTRRRSSGTVFSTARSSSDFLNVAIPEAEMKNPSSSAASARRCVPVKQWINPVNLPCPSSSCKIAMVSSSASRVCTISGSPSSQAAAMWARKFAICASRGLCS